eukprot:1668947-Rhodomonas_salina.1
MGYQGWSRGCCTDSTELVHSQLYELAVRGYEGWYSRRCTDSAYECTRAGTGAVVLTRGMGVPGLVQWVEHAYDLQHILEKYSDIRLFFRACSQRGGGGERERGGGGGEGERRASSSSSSSSSSHHHHHPPPPS